jgi:hypothetical protein
MNFRTLELNLAQLARCIQKSRFNKYSDKRKEQYQKTLAEVFESVQAHDYSKFTANQLITKKQIIDFVFESIEYLDNSTLTVIPFEMVYCLEEALNEWIPKNTYIVVTSLSNSLLSYSIKDSLALNPAIYALIQNDYNKAFNHRLIQITLPRYYVHDYLANVVLYHELGHFIDRTYKISESIVFIQAQKNNMPLNHPDIPIYVRHYMEYFADIFAAQYVGNASNLFLDYIAHKIPDSYTHPATDKRIEVVKNFLDGNHRAEPIAELMQMTHAKTGMNLQIRFDNLPLDDFNSLLPYELINERQLHSIFLAGWNAWQEQPNNLTNQFGNDVAYKAINNLIEKSISNYIVVKNWNS